MKVKPSKGDIYARRGGIRSDDSQKGHFISTTRALLSSISSRRIKNYLRNKN